MKKSILWFLLPAFIVVAGSILYSCTEKEEDLKGTIYGTVTDLQTNEPISGVNVKLKSTGEATLTGSDGSFEFKDLDANKYSLSFSKAEYADLDDDYIIELEAGKKMKRDVQMRKRVAILTITDMAGNEINSVDFGREASIVSKSINVYNSGTQITEFELMYNCLWIDTIIAGVTQIAPGQTVTVTIIIDRNNLLAGDNSTYLHIISSNGSNDLMITAKGYTTPIVETNDITSITSSSATLGGTIIDDGGNEIIVRGVCWSTSSTPTIDNNNYRELGNGTGTFSGNITGMTPNTTYYVRAYATNHRGTSYGEQKTFSTLNGLPIVETFAPTRSNLVVTTGGNVTSDGGYPIIERGVCYSRTPYPDTSSAHNHICNGSGTGAYSSTFTMTDVGVYYVRAYAINSNGIAYGEQMTIDHPYYELPSFTYGGRIYRVAPSSSSGQAVGGGYSVALYGLSGWRLPSKDELSYMYTIIDSIGGFGYDKYWSGTQHHYDGNTGSYYYYVNMNTGYVGYSHASALYFHRWVRVEN